MANYYYLVTSLPTLKNDSQSFMSVEDFLALCKRQISRRDYRVLEEVALGDGPVEVGGFVEGYTRFRSELESELARQRALALGLDTSPYAQSTDAALVSAVHRAVVELDPLSAEKLLLSLHFSYLEKSRGMAHDWDLVFLISYALRLKLLEKKASFTTERGREEFSQLFGQMRKRIFE